MQQKKLYHLVAVGGTFDRLHQGHQTVLTKAFLAGKSVLIGLTSDTMVQNKQLGATILPYKKRAEELQNYLTRMGWIERVTITPIDDIYGPAATDSSLEAIVVTRETAPNAKKINQLRKKNNLTPLHIMITPLVKGMDGRPIASHKIRLGQEDRVGTVYTSVKLKLAPKIISDVERQTLKKPLGKFIAGQVQNLSIATSKARPFLAHCPLLVTVGDVATRSILQVGVQPQLAIVDLYINRKPTHKTINEFGFIHSPKMITVTNPRGNISRSLFSGIKKAMKPFQSSLAKNKPLSAITTVIRVLGEEDLAVLPTILLSPLKTIVIYGQPFVAAAPQGKPFSYASHGKPFAKGREGLVVVEVTEEKKHQVFKLQSTLPQKS